MTYLRHPRLARYAVALAAVAAAALIEHAAWGVFHAVPFMLFYAAVMIAVWYGGPGPGLVAVASSALLVEGLLIPPHGTFMVTSPEAAPRLAGFVLVCVLIV